MQKYANLVELKKCCQTHIFLQNIDLIQPRTSPLKICKIYLQNLLIFCAYLRSDGAQAPDGQALRLQPAELAARAHVPEDLSVPLHTKNAGLQMSILSEYKTQKMSKLYSIRLLLAPQYRIKYRIMMFFIKITVETQMFHIHCHSFNVLRHVVACVLS